MAGIIPQVPAHLSLLMEIPVANPAMEVADALDMMISQGLTLLPIVMDRRLAGVVLRVDLMQALLLDASTPLPERD